MPCVIAVSLKVIADHNLVGGGRMKRGYVSESPGTFPTDGKVEGVCLGKVPGDQHNFLFTEMP